MAANFTDVGSDAFMGRLNIVLRLDIPGPKFTDQYGGGGVIRAKPYDIESYACTEANGLKIAEEFRRLNPHLLSHVEITWTGGRRI